MITEQHIERLEEIEGDLDTEKILSRFGIAWDYKAEPLGHLSRREQSEIGMAICLDKYLELEEISLRLTIISKTFAASYQLREWLTTTVTRITKAQLLIEGVHRNYWLIWARKA